MRSISLCMIVKNEEKALRRCLDSVKDAVDEIVIVDTGSEDKTVEIAEEYTDRVYSFLWCEDFSAARNFSFSRASKEYCMWMDADDILPEKEREKLLKWKTESDGSVDAAMLKYVTAWDENGVPEMVYYRERLLKREKHFRWEGRIHEAITVTGKVEYLDISVEHHSLKKTYSTRNLDIYRRMLKEGERFTPRDRFYYGRELFYHGFYGECVENLADFLLLPGGFVENQVEACRIAAECCYKLGREGEALEFLYRGLTFRVPSGELCCDLGRHFFDRERWELAAFWYENALRAPIKEQSGSFIRRNCYDYLPCIQLSVCYHRLGDLKKALAYHKLAGKYKPAGREYLRNEAYFQRLE